MGTLETSMFHPELVVKFESQFDEEIGTYRALVIQTYPDNSIAPSNRASSYHDRSSKNGVGSYHDR